MRVALFVSFLLLCVAVCGAQSKPAAPDFEAQGAFTYVYQDTSPLLVPVHQEHLRDWGWRTSLGENANSWFGVEGDLSANDQEGARTIRAEAERGVGRQRLCFGRESAGSGEALIRR